jgi:hypothetical protein
VIDPVLAVALLTTPAADTERPAPADHTPEPGADKVVVAPAQSDSVPEIGPAMGKESTVIDLVA